MKTFQIGDVVIVDNRELCHIKCIVKYISDSEYIKKEHPLWEDKGALCYLVNGFDADIIGLFYAKDLVPYE